MLARSIAADALAIPVLSFVYLRWLATCALAIPVLVAVYVEEIARRSLVDLRGAAVAGGLALALAGSSLPFVPPAGAIPPGAGRDAAPLVFKPVEIASSEGLSAAPVSSAVAPSALPRSIADAIGNDAEAAPVPTAPAFPEVVRFRPRNGWTAVDRGAEVSVRFTTAMEHETTARAFQVTVDDRLFSGGLRWAEGDTVLVLDPSSPFPYGATVVLAVEATALSAAGVPLAAPAQVTFRVESRPEPKQPAGPPPPVPTSTGWAWPLGGPITQRFGESLTRYGVHHGIDIDADTGDQVRASRAGLVTVAGHHDSCGGIEVHIDHDNGIVTWYRHLSRVDVGVGQGVGQGEIIGRVGNTGCSLGSHLHFAMRRGSTWLDPLDYLPNR